MLVQQGIAICCRRLPFNCVRIVQQVARCYKLLLQPVAATRTRMTGAVGSRSVEHGDRVGQQQKLLELPDLRTNNGRCSPVGLPADRAGLTFDRHFTVSSQRPSDRPALTSGPGAASASPGGGTTLRQSAALGCPLQPEHRRATCLARAASCVQEASQAAARIAYLHEKTATDAVASHHECLSAVIIGRNFFHPLIRGLSSTLTAPFRLSHCFLSTLSTPPHHSLPALSIYSDGLCLPSARTGGFLESASVAESSRNCLLLANRFICDSAGSHRICTAPGLNCASLFSSLHFSSKAVHPTRQAASG